MADKLFGWEWPLRQADLAALGPAAPDGPILGARVAGEGVQEEGGGQAKNELAAALI